MQDTPLDLHKDYLSYTLMLDTHFYRDVMTGASKASWDGFSENRGRAYLQHFPTLMEAYNFAKGKGYSIDVLYPKGRYTLKKHYQDNLAWKGPPKEVEDVTSIQ